MGGVLPSPPPPAIEPESPSPGLYKGRGLPVFMFKGSEDEGSDGNRPSNADASHDDLRAYGPMCASRTLSRRALLNTILT